MDCLLFKLPMSRLGSAWNVCSVRKPSDWTELHSAICSDDGEAVLKLAQRDGAAVNLADFRRRTPCMFAVEMNSLEALKSLVLCGGDTSIRAVMHMNALDMAVFCGNGDAVHICLNSGFHGSDDLCTQEPCWSSMIIAVSGNRPSILNSLIDHNLSVKCFHSTSPSPLDVACIMGNREVLEVLMRYPSQFDVAKATDSLDSPLFATLKAHPFKVGHLLCFSAILSRLLRDGVPLLDSNGEHVLHVAFRMGRDECMEELLGRDEIWKQLLRAVENRFAFHMPPTEIFLAESEWDRMFHWMKIYRKRSLVAHSFIGVRLSGDLLINYMTWMDQESVYPAVQTRMDAPLESPSGVKRSSPTFETETEGEVHEDYNEKETGEQSCPAVTPSKKPKRLFNILNW